MPSPSTNQAAVAPIGDAVVGDGATAATATVTADFSGRQRFVKRVELMQLVLGGLLFAAAFAMAPTAVWIGVGTGAAVAIANFHAMASLLQRLTQGSAKSQSIAVILLMIKLLVVAGAVLAILTWLGPDSIAFAVGLSVMPLSLIVVSAFFRPEAQA